MHFLQFPSAFVLLWRKNDPFIMDYLWPITFVVSLSRSIWIVNMIWRMKILNNDYSLANFIINFSFSDNCFLDISSQNNNWISRGHSALSLSWSWFCLNDSFTKKVQVKVSSNVFNATLSGASGSSCLSETSLAPAAGKQKMNHNEIKSYQLS